MSLQFVLGLSNSIQALTGSTAFVSVIGVSAGANASAVTVITSVAFAGWSSANSSSLPAYLAVLSSSTPASLYGAQFAGTAVDLTSIHVSYVPASGKHCVAPTDTTSACSMLTMLACTLVVPYGDNLHELRGLE